MTKQQLPWKTKWNTATDFEADQLNTSSQKKIHIHQGVGNKHQSSVTVRTRLSGTGFLLSLSTTTADCCVLTGSTGRWAVPRREEQHSKTTVGLLNM